MSNLKKLTQFWQEYFTRSQTKYLCSFSLNCIWCENEILLFSIPERPQQFLWFDFFWHLSPDEWKCTDLFLVSCITISMLGNGARALCTFLLIVVQLKQKKIWGVSPLAQSAKPLPASPEFHTDSGSCPGSCDSDSALW